MNQNHLFNKIRSNPIMLISLLAVLGISSLAVYPWKTHEPINSSSQISSTAEPTKNPSSNREVVFAGSGSNLSMIRILAAEFQKTAPELKIKVPPSIGSTGGINAVLDGKITVALISRPLREEEQKFGLRVIPYAQTAVVIGAHPTVSDDNVTYTDLIDIYKGTKTRWSDGEEIIVLSRDPGDSLIFVLQQNVPGFKEVYAESQEAKRWMTLFTDQESNQVLADTEHAIGLADLGVIITEKVKVKVLQVHGIAPTAENVTNGKYPFAKTLAFVLPPREISPEVGAFIDFVRSREGAKILSSYGFIPVQ